MKKSNIAPWLISTVFLSGFTAFLISMPQTMSEFLVCFAFCFFMWGGMFVGMLYE